SVRAKGSTRVLIRATRHGPVISDLVTLESATEVLALRWTAHEPSKEFRSSYGINQAQNWEQFLAALAHHTAPTINYTYADSENNIGYALAGKIPLRASGHSLLPLDGSSSANDWRGFIPFESLPR